MLELIEELYGVVWDFRKIAGDKWPTPDARDSVRYAFTEAGEAMDAWLRANRPNHVRNNEDDSKVDDELADCLIMLVTAFGPGRTFRNWHVGSRKDLDEICGSMAFLMTDIADGNNGLNTSEAVYAIGSIISYVGEENIKGLVVGRLGRIAGKNGVEWGTV